MSVSSTPLVSIVMASYNSEYTIRESIESVIAQTFSNWELIISDDNSSDNTLSILKEYGKRDTRIRYLINNENRGAGFARNQSIEESKGRYIAFLDSDDLWSPNKLSVQIAFMSENNYPFTYTSYRKFNSKGDRGRVVPPERINRDELLYSNVIGCLTVVYDRQYFGKKYMPLIRKRQDMLLWLELLKNVEHAYGINEELAKYRIDSGMTVNKFGVLKYQWQLYRDTLQLDILSSVKLFVVYSVKGLVKYLK